MSQLNGILLIDKPTGMTSHDVVARVRRALNTKSVGHCGTLDPLASGLLIMLIGQGTKISDYLLLQSKTYMATIQLGLTTDSFDITGAETSRTDTVVTPEQVSDAIAQLTGELQLAVPVFSATKVQGRPLYDYARKGQEVEAPVKTMSFFDIQVLENSYPKVTVLLSCSKGSFIRTWASELGRILGVGATLTSLQRVNSHPWSVDQAMPLEDLMRMKDETGQAPGAEQLRPSFVTLAEALPHLKTVMADGKEQKLLANGQIPHTLQNRLIFEMKEAHRSGEALGIRVMSASDRAMIAILQAVPGQGLKIRRVFPAV